MTTTGRILIAQGFGLENVQEAAAAHVESGLPFFAACALLTKESPDPARKVAGGANVWGHDKVVRSDGTTDWGVFSGYDGLVTEQGYALFRHEVLVHGRLSNGVGPTQITSPLLLAAMEAEFLRPWDPHDNMLFGFRLLWQYYNEQHSWVHAGERYNGRHSYGLDLLAKCQEWHDRFKVRGPLEP